MRRRPTRPVCPSRRTALVWTGGLAWAGLALPTRAAAATATASAAPPEEVSAAFNSPGQPARLIGQARMRFLGLTIYDARLWATSPLSPELWQRQAFALSLDYARSLSGLRIVDRSLDEMRRQAAFDTAQAERWRAQLTPLCPDVTAGDRLTGLYAPTGPARFSLNGRPLGHWADPLGVRLFFGIWLSPETSEPSLRQQLLGLS